MPPRSYRTLADMEQDAERAAVAAAEEWLSLIDAGSFAEGWNRAASLFKAAVSVQQWQTSLEAGQTRLGRAVSRTLRSKRYTEELPGAPDGEYVVIEYETAFERKKRATETVTPMKDEDGEWRVCGYFMR